MKTDAKTMAGIWLAVSENEVVDIEYFDDGEWHDKANLNFDPLNTLYRIKPKTITVNGVEIPKPLSLEELKDKNIYFFPALTLNLFDSSYRYWLAENQVKFIYKTKEEAIETSKKLFGIE